MMDQGLLDRIARHPLWKWAMATGHSLFRIHGTVGSSWRLSWSMRLFYFLVFVRAFESIGKLGFSSTSRTVDPLWPVYWVDGLGEGGFWWLHLAFLVASMAAMLFPMSRWTRIPLFLSLLLYSAYLNSFGKIDHGWHLFLWVSFILMFVSSDPRQSAQRSLAFAWAQGVILLTYSMSGLYKLWGGLMQWRGGEISMFSIDGLSNQVAHRLLQTNSDSTLGQWVVENEWPGFLMLLGAVYLEVFSLFVLFRPRIHRLWAVMLILMHTGIFLAMTIGFSNSVMVLGAILIFSPFAPDGRMLSRASLSDLPLFGNLFLIPLFFEKDKPRTLYYDGECGFCNGFLFFLIRKARAEGLRYATIGGEAYGRRCGEVGSLAHFDTLMMEQDEEVMLHSRAALLALGHSAKWRWAAILLLFIPRELADPAYMLVARVRKKLAGEYCFLPDADERALFVE